MTSAHDTLDRLYLAISRADWPAVAEAFHSEAFVLSPASDGVLIGPDAIVDDLKTWRGHAANLDLHVERVVTGSSSSGDATWVFDNVVAPSTPLRVTALLEGGAIRAAYWSIPYATQDEQDAVKHSGDLEPGIVFEAHAPDEMSAVVEQLRSALGSPREIPPLYSERPDQITIGSVTDEVFIGPAGRAAWSEFVEHVTAFDLRGPVRAELVAPDAGWLAANIDVGSPPTPYRFFYVWVREEGEWQIVVSHDAVSRDVRT